MWDTTIGSWQEAPWFGHGMGSAAVLMEETYGLEHPHNDYLRVLHDLGLVGLSLWVLGLLKLLSHEYRQWRWEYYAQHKSEAIVHKAAFLSLAAFIMSMATDNSISYLFVMLPLGITLGASAGLFSSRAAT
jgi:O-antigen ligase